MLSWTRATVNISVLRYTGLVLQDLILTWDLPALLHEYTLHFACLSIGGTPNSLLAFTFGWEVLKAKRQESGKKWSLQKQYLGMSDHMLQPMIFPHNGDLCYCVCGIITKTDFFFFNGTINRIFLGLFFILNRIFTSPLGSEGKESKCQMQAFSQS